jgi:LuxR family maltose regulon positive regulatory protein
VTTILQTKLRPPATVPGLVARPRLIEVFKQNPRRPLTLVSAPAGYGKTTLVTQWLQATEAKPAWFSLGEEDGDPRTFLSYLVAAVKVRHPEACRHTTALLQAAKMPPANVLADSLNNDLDAIDRPLVLVLDDYHRVTNTAVHELLDNVLRYPPRPLHLVLTTRRDPPISLAYLRARGWLTEIRQDDLRFSRPEVRAVFEQMAGVSVSESALTHLEDEMEGWIVGLHLVGLLLRNQNNPEAFLSGLKGGFQQIHEYLLEEVLARQPARVRDCLLGVSLLDRFCASLVDAICPPDADTTAGAISGEDFVDRIQRDNLFVIPLDAHGRWFRYHHLFQDLLLGTLERERTSQEIRACQARASAWFESQGLITDSIKHAVAAGDDLRAAHIIERYRDHEFTADRWYVVQRWLTMLPPDITCKRPKLLLTEAWIATLRHQMSRLPKILKQAKSLLRSETAEPTVSGELGFLLGYSEYFDGQAEGSRQHLEEAVSQLSGAKTPLLSEAELMLGLARCMAGQNEKAVRTLEDRIDEVDSSEGQRLSRLIASLAFIHLVCGDMPRAGVEAQRLRRVAKKFEMSLTEAWSSYMWACTHLHTGEFEAASQHFADAVDRRYVLEPRAAVDALAGLALTQQFLRLDNEVTETTVHLQEFAQELNERQYLSVARSCQARVSLLRGDLTPAIEWARSANDPPVPSGLFMWLEAPPITHARVLIAAGSERSLEQADALLREIRQVSEACRFTCQTIEVALLQSLSLQKQGRTDEALAAVTEAVALAEPGGWVRPFVELGEPMAELLRRLSTRNVAVESVDRLLAAFPERQPEAAPEKSMLSSVSDSNRPIAAGPTHAGSQAADATVGHVSLVEPLTDRELDVLQLLAERLYDKEIAKNLSISVHTVRSHVKHIFEKLHVAGRRQAVLKAEELGLLRGS